jgi:NNP family nitrate/nitrite transporter-like MFS transporter
LGILRTATFALSGYVLFAVFRFTIGLILPGVTSEFRLTSAEAGVFASAPLLATVLTMGVAGYVSDRINRKIIFSAGIFILWLGVLLSSLSPSYLVALCFMFIAGAGAGLLPPSIYSIMGGLRPGSRASLTGVTASTYNLGGFAGSVGIGLLIAASGWRLSLAALSAIGLVYLPLMYLFMGTSSSTEGSSKGGRPAGSSYRTLLKSRNTISAGASLFMAMYASFSIISWVPTYLVHTGVSSSLVGVVVGVFSLAGGVTAIVSGRLADAWGEKRLILTTGAMAGIVSVLLFLYRFEFNSMFVLIVLLGLLIWPSWNLTTSMVQRMVEPAAVGSITGLVQTLGMAGGFLGPVVTGLLVSSYGLGTAILGSVVVSLWLYTFLIMPFREAPKSRVAESLSNDR